MDFDFSYWQAEFADTKTRQIDIQKDEIHMLKQRCVFIGRHCLIMCKGLQNFIVLRIALAYFLLFSSLSNVIR